MLAVSCILFLDFMLSFRSMLDVYFKAHFKGACPRVPFLNIRVSVQFLSVPLLPKKKEWIIIYKTENAQTILVVETGILLLLFRSQNYYGVTFSLYSF